ncbi:heme exporter protein CcmD [Aliikangiella coralliicola]|uniref:Heme exporter protein D n=1 Tax=Aliikangiella coralliicola TaxID=2592383 RepID=A0A545UAE4_9GAMM|nr:heme exporter protein CcmD [Aliikangiella coralliicola]TQV86429.1 heme exporter protein CcmD [Aliikangiella coralliicola]
MTMQEFFHMGGHGFYIWTSYAVGTVVFIGLFLMVKFQRDKIIKQLRRRYRQQKSVNEQNSKTTASSNKAG